MELTEPIDIVLWIKRQLEAEGRPVVAGQEVRVDGLKEQQEQPHWFTLVNACKEEGWVEWTTMNTLKLTTGGVYELELVAQEMSLTAPTVTGRAGQGLDEWFQRQEELYPWLASRVFWLIGLVVALIVGYIFGQVT